jgi:hypothetical protein
MGIQATGSVAIALRRVNARQRAGKRAPKRNNIVI